MADSAAPPKAPNQAVLFPAYTWDYRVSKGELGYGLVATRNIKKGKQIYEDSLEFSFGDVVEGDKLLFYRHEKASRKAGGSSKTTTTTIPEYYSLSRETLLRTHGVPTLQPDPTGESAGIVTWRLEVPGMFMNHSCEPNTIDYPRCTDRGEGYASRNIHRGEELTCDYALQYYDEGPLFAACMCGASSCRGSMMGFKALTDEQKETLLPAASDAVRAMHMADKGLGLPVKKMQSTFPERAAPAANVHDDDDNNNKVVTRLVCPGPSCALADAVVKKTVGGGDNVQEERDHPFSLYSLKDYASGEKVYEFWCQSFPIAAVDEIDMVFASPVTETTDPPEGTVVRIRAREMAQRHRNGDYKFSCWEMMTRHDCDPNLVYDEDDSDDEEDWRSAFAVKEIKAGDLLTVDLNSLLWDRSDCPNSHSCACGSKKCKGTVRGFKYLPKDAQEELKSLSWKRLLQEEEDETIRQGEALAPHVRESWRKDPEMKHDAPDSESDSESSSSSDSD